MIEYETREKVIYLDFIILDPTFGKFHFPVNPEEVLIRREKQYETATIISLGEIDIFQGEKVKEIAFSAFFPREYDPSYCRYSDIPDPQVAMNRLTAMLYKKQPVRLIITDTIINSLVHVSAHDSTFKGGEPGDVYFDVTFRSWRNVTVGRTSPAEKSTRSDTKPIPKLYLVKPGDTLMKISKQELGTSSKWRAIYDKNKAIIGNNADLIKPGQKLVMP